MRNDQLLGVNKIGKNIKKTSSSSSSKPQVSSNNNRFKSIVGQLQSSPLQKSLLETPKINMPHVLPPPPLVMSQQAHILAIRPPIRPYIRSLPRGSTIPMMGHGDQFRYNAAESPVSLHMPSYTQGSLVDSGLGGNQIHPSQGYVQRLQPQPQVQCEAQQQPRLNGLARDTPILPTPRFKVTPQQIHSNSLPGTRFDGPGILPSPTSQSLTANRNFLAPRPLYPSSPTQGARYTAPPLTPRSYTFSIMSQPGILGPGTFPQLSPGSPR